MHNLGYYAPLLAQRGGGGGGDEAAAAAFAMVMIVIVCVMLAVSIAIMVFILYVLYKSLDSVPEQYRTMEPWQVLLLLIPCFPIVWNFFVYQKIPESFRNYFNAMGRHEDGDCGQQLGLWYAIVVCASIIPIVNYIAGPASLVLLIILLVKFWTLRRVAEQLSLGQGGGGKPVGEYGQLADPKNPYASPGDYGS